MKNLLHTFRKDQLDEIVFANRNKAYGAYALRNDYSTDLTKALFVGVAFFASISVIPLIVSAFSSSQDIMTTTVCPIPIVLDNVDTPDPTKPIPASAVPQHVKTVESPNYLPTRIVRNDKPAPTEDEKKNAAISSQTSPGTETNIVSVPPVVTSGPPANVPYTPPVKVEDPDKIRTTSEVDVAADFKGGIDAFRQKVAQNFDTESIQDGVVSAVITFVVEKDGSISNLKINGSNADFNSEAERAVKSVKSKWTPAQFKGKAVRSSFRMPISMRIE